MSFAIRLRQRSVFASVLSRAKLSVPALGDIDILDSMSDGIGVYVAVGVLSIVVFVVGVALIVRFTAIEPTTGTLVAFTVGFLIYMGVYFASFYVMRFVEGAEEG